MNLKKLDWRHKLFIAIGIPCFLFIFFILINFYILFTAFYLIVLVVFLLGHFRKKDSYFRLTKIGLLMVIIFFVNFYNISRIPSQMQVHSPGGRTSLIEPENPHMVELEQDFHNWHKKKHNQSFLSVDESSYEKLEAKLQRVHYYIYYYRMEYTPDSEAPYHTSDYIANIDEIFQSDTDGDGRLQDDCDGISLVTATLLIRLGYNAFIAECIGHWNTIIFPQGINPKTKEGFNQGIHLYNWWGRPTFYMFNQSEVLIPPERPVYKSIGDVFFDERTYKYDFLDFFKGRYIDLPVYILLLLAYVLIFLASALTFYLVKLGIDKDQKIRKLKWKWFFSKRTGKSIFIGSLIAAYSAFIIFWFTVSGLGFMGTFFVALTFIGIMRYFELTIRNNNKMKNEKNKI